MDGLPGRAVVESAGGEAGAHPGHATDPRPQLRPRLLIRHPRPSPSGSQIPAPSTRSGCVSDSTASSSARDWPRHHLLGRQEGLFQPKADVSHEMVSETFEKHTTVSNDFR